MEQKGVKGSCTKQMRKKKQRGKEAGIDLEKRMDEWVQNWPKQKA